ncbi:MAG: cytochrome C oxidase subunit IV family protein [Actinomycetota bacterium]
MATATDQAPVESHDDHDAHHPSDWEYIKIAIILAILTAIEVGMFFLEESVAAVWLYLGLTVLMIIKFFMVVAYFMHLKYDTPWFRRIFVAGLVLAIGVYAIFFFAFDYFGLG